MEKIVSLCKRRGFVFPGSEIYGGLANTYDYGPLGVELKNNIKKIWWKQFVSDREDMVGLDGGIIMSPKIWEASGHAKNFQDPLVECKKCHHRFRPDKLVDASKCPDCGGEFTAVKMFNCMFKTTIGPIEKDGLQTYLRPETAGAIFVNFKNILQSMNKKIPFGIGQIGKAFRNEITTGNFIFRTLEFDQMEIEYFINPASDWNIVFEKWRDEMHTFGLAVGLDEKKIFDHEIADEDRAFYSKRTIDVEYEFPFGQDELWGLAYRTDYDLQKHAEFSHENLSYFDDESKSRFVPHVIEPSFGLDRTVLAVLSEAYNEELVKEGDTRIVLKLKPAVAPFQVAVFPLLANKENLVAKARELLTELKKDFSVAFDARGNIGKRYRYQDEIGTPFCVTVDFDTVEKGTVTVRDRDSMQQETINLSEIKEYLQKKM
ncbi:MAG: glycine--tRNA ligase [Patescibacteria group bacterium]